MLTKLHKNKGVAEGLRSFAVLLTGISVLSVSVITLAPRTVVYGYTAVKGTVTAKSGCFVRSDASTSSSCAFCVSKDDEVTVLGYKESAGKEKWYKIKIGDSVGFIRSDLVTVTGKVEKLSETDAGAGNAASGSNAASSVNTASTGTSTGVVTGTAETVSTDTIKNPFSLGTLAAQVQVCKVKGLGVNVRDVPVGGNVLAKVSEGHSVTVTECKKGEDGNIWCRISFVYKNKPVTGYIRSDFVDGVRITDAGGTAETALTGTAESGLTKPVVYDQTQDFDQILSVLPESYRGSLSELHTKHPNWIFKPVATNLDWNTSVEKESTAGKNLVAMESPSSYKSTEPQAYNSFTQTWYGFEGGVFASASKDLVAYCMDPRNFLDEENIFQFETLEYNEHQDEEGVKAILEGTFLEGSYNDTDGSSRSYCDTFMEAGKSYGISPYNLAERCVREQGSSGSGLSISGTVPGYENFFNFFNIGAYAANGNNAETNGVIYASGTDEEYLRPWNSRYRSIKGSAKYISDKYIKTGQNTLYFQKFNVVNGTNGIYSHQYMNHLLAAMEEAETLKKAHYDPDKTIVFYIPYYSNMPETPCAKPEG